MLQYSFNKEELKPSAEVSNLVDGYFYVECNGIQGIYSDTQRCLPCGMIELIIHLDGDKSLGLCNNEWMSFPRAYCVGMMLKPTIWRMPTGSRMFGVKFKPEAFVQLFNIKVNDIINNHIDAECVFGSSINYVIDRVINAATFKDRVLLIEDFVKSAVKANPINEDHFATSLKLIRNCTSPFTTSLLTNKLQVSERTLQRIYKDNIGVGPKAYHRIIRFKKAMELAKSKQMNLTSISYELGYTDQAHFIKDFKVFSGVSPKYVFDDTN